MIQYTLGEKRCTIGNNYSSEMLVNGNKRSINYQIIIHGEQNEVNKLTLLEYRLRWEVDGKGDFVRWEKP